MTRNVIMNSDSIEPTADQPRIKSWFGFFLGLFAVTLSLSGFAEGMTWGRVFSTLGFLCLWYPWTQLTGWAKPWKNFFKNKLPPMSKSCNYLSLAALAFLLLGILL